MIAGMTLTQWQEWKAFYDLHHLGEYPDYRADIRSGNVAAAVINVNRPKGRKQVSIDEAMPKLTEGDDKAPMSAAELHHTVREMIRQKTPKAPRRDRDRRDA